MALREIRELGDEVLRKKAKEVKILTPRLKELIGDMFDTMYAANGVGLAAPQVGILRRIVVIDCGDNPITLINPVIVEKDGQQIGEEGCLSVPGKVGVVERAMHCRVRAKNADMQDFEVEGEGLLARCLQHEIDHLDGKMYVDIATEMRDVTAESEDEEQEETQEE
ncbi:MAG: peptide deformylase [Lachnospiraceae bacterium]|jgi:peptide deformylase|nr:peptide deformylase [Lachnospiraceae bacterium]MCH4070028.1 peptide deformylase [Lachnospiraceae bacterium]MCH4108620.1 peptide deformylase [Lachnospiraceae bacterium]MCI1332556.1 peptide deformylase [Lachnospiraceae bacterium]MCI1361988.1 peptide deformylase [Lachnospiraceae bacterium]